MPKTCVPSNRFVLMFCFLAHAQKKALGKDSQCIFSFSYFALPLKEKNYILSWEIKIFDPMVLLSRCFSPFLFSGICDPTPWKVSIYKLYINKLPQTSESKWRTRTLSILLLKGRGALHPENVPIPFSSLHDTQFPGLYPPFLFWSLVDRVHYTLKMRQFPAVL